MVHPAGVVTASFRSAGWSPVSKTTLAAPFMVCAARRVATSRGKPTFTPASASDSENDVCERRPACGKTGHRVHVLFIEHNGPAHGVEHGPSNFDMARGPHESPRQIAVIPQPTAAGGVWHRSDHCHFVALATSGRSELLLHETSSAPKPQRKRAASAAPISVAISCNTSATVWGFTVSRMMSAPLTASRLSVVTATPSSFASAAASLRMLYRGGDALGLQRVPASSTHAVGFHPTCQRRALLVSCRKVSATCSKCLS